MDLQENNDINEIFKRFLQKLKCRCLICDMKMDYSREVAEHYYCAIDRDGQFNDFNDKFIDWSETTFKDYLSTGDISMATLRANYENYGTYNVQNGYQGLRGVKNLYRKTPVPWQELNYLNLPVVRRPGAPCIGYTEHSVRSLIGSEDMSDSIRYNQITMKTRSSYFSYEIWNFNRQLWEFSKTLLW